MKTIKPIQPPAAYVGGKRLLAKTIINRINSIPHKSYIEPFFGMGGIFFRRDEKPACEIINDVSGELINFFRVAQKHPEALLKELEFQLASRDEFERYKKMEDSCLTDVERAARWYYLQKNAFGGKVTGQSFGVSTGQKSKFNTKAIQKRIQELHERLASVTIENLPFEECIKRYDKPTTLFYLDPPYWGMEDYYGNHIFQKSDFEKLAKLLKTLKGRFILSLNDAPEVRALFKDFTIEPAEVRYTLSGQGSTKKAKEVIISN